MANGVAEQPKWDRLLAIGVDYVRNSQSAWIFIAGNVVLQVLGASFNPHAASGIIAQLAILAAAVYLTLLLTRHALTGAFGPQEGDGTIVLKVFGLFFAAVLAMSAVGGLLLALLIVVLGGLGAVLGIVLLVAAGLFVVARFAFYLPALSVGHPTSLRQAFAQTEPYWARILAVTLAPAVVTIAVSLLLTRLLPGLSGALLAGLVGGTIGAAGGAATLAAIA